MKIAFLHNLPIEYYPPATNMLDFFAASTEIDIRAYTTNNSRGRKRYTNKRVSIKRTAAPDPKGRLVTRMAMVVWWHLKTALSLLSYKPTVLIQVEPHSAIAAYIYCGLLRQRVRIFIHHHEYYGAKDYDRPGMRIPKIGNMLERKYLFRRAEWISETNTDRLNMIKRDNPEICAGTWHVLPNYPPAKWSRSRVNERESNGFLKLVYVGSASCEDTYIKEIIEWVSKNPKHASLDIYGYNIDARVWDWLDSEKFPNIGYDPSGCEYRDLPDILKNYDIGVVLYKGKTNNFIYNVPNKVYEYMACGLDVWYPREMKSIQNYRWDNVLRPLELDFQNLKNLRIDYLIGRLSRVQGSDKYRSEDVLNLLLDAIHERKKI